MCSIYEIFEKKSKTCEEKLAIVTKQNKMTYRELNLYIEELSNCLKEVNIKSNEAIGFALSNGIDFVALLLVCLKLNKPMVLFGNSMSSEELHYHIENIGLQEIVACEEMNEILSGAGCEKRNDLKKHLTIWNYASKERGNICEEDLFCQFSSGTSGRPKAVIRTKSAVKYEIEQTLKTFDFSEKDSFMTLVPIHHSYGLILGTIIPLLMGGKLCLVDQFIPSEIIQQIKIQETTVLLAVPYMYHLFVRATQNSNFKVDFKEQFASLKFCFSGGAPLQSGIVEDFKKVFAKDLIQDYGTTETGVICINRDITYYNMSAGIPVGDYEVKAFDEDGEIVSANHIGELRVKSKALARKYIYPAELNKAFIDGWFCTGDIGYVDDNGYINIQARKSNIINVAGRKVDPVEVENVIKRIDGVNDVVVLGIDVGESGQAVKAFVVTEQAIKALDIIRFCRKNMATYKVPRYISFINEIPRNETGKILKKNLLELKEEYA